MIYVDQDAAPSASREHSGASWGQIAIALMIAVRESESRLLVLDASGLTEVKDEA